MGLKYSENFKKNKPDDSQLIRFSLHWFWVSAKILRYSDVMKTFSAACVVREFKLPLSCQCAGATERMKCIASVAGVELRQCGLDVNKSVM